MSDSLHKHRCKPLVDPLHLPSHSCADTCSCSVCGPTHLRLESSDKLVVLSRQGLGRGCGLFTGDSAAAAVLCVVGGPALGTERWILKRQRHLHPTPPPPPPPPLSPPSPLQPSLVQSCGIQPAAAAQRPACMQLPCSGAGVRRLCRGCSLSRPPCRCRPRGVWGSSQLDVARSKAGACVPAAAASACRLAP